MPTSTVIKKTKSFLKKKKKIPKTQVIATIIFPNKRDNGLDIYFKNPQNIRNHELNKP